MQRSEDLFKLDSGFGSAPSGSAVKKASPVGASSRTTPPAERAPVAPTASIHQTPTTTPTLRAGGSGPQQPSAPIGDPVTKATPLAAAPPAPPLLRIHRPAGDGTPLLQDGLPDPLEYAKASIAQNGDRPAPVRFIGGEGNVVRVSSKDSLDPEKYAAAILESRRGMSPEARAAVERSMNSERFSSHKSDGMGGLVPVTSAASGGAARGGGGLSRIDPNTDLRNTQINPGFDPRYEAEAAALVRGAGAPTADTTRAREIVMQALESLNSAPDRGQIAADRLSLLEERSEPGFQRALQQAMKLNAAGGRMGSGLVTRDLADVTDSRSKYIDQSRRELATESAAMEMSDRLNRTGAAQGVMGQLAGLDLSNAALALQKSGLLKSFDDTRFAQESSMRNELRGERGYQADQAQTALNNRVNQVQLEDFLENSAHGRESDRLRLMLSTMFGGNSDALLAQLLSNQAGQTGGSGAGANLLAMWAMQQGRNGGAATAGNTTGDRISGGYA